MVTINSAEANRASIRYLKESTWGTTPASGTTRQVRLTSSSLSASKETQISDEIRADRMIPSIAEVSALSSGSIEGEFSAGTYDDFFESFLLGAWSQAMNHFLVKGTTVTVTGASEITITGTDWTDWLASGQYIKLEGFLDPENNGVFTMSGTAAFSGGNTVITVTESSLVVESGSAYTTIMDARDVLTKATTVTVESGNVIDNNSGTPFSGLVAGQTIFLDSRLGKETGTITFSDAPVAGESTVISDGTNTAKTYEWNTSAAAATSGNVFILLTASEGGNTIGLHEAVNDQFRRKNSRVSSAVTTGTKETGTFTFITGAMTAGDSVSVNDGSVTVTYTFIAGSTNSGTDVGVGASHTDSGTNLAAAINAQYAAGVSRCSASGTDTVTVTNDFYIDGALVEIADSSNYLTVADFSSGVAPILTFRNGFYTGGSITTTATNDTTVDFSGGDASKGGFKTVQSIGSSGLTVTVDETTAADTNAGSVEVVVKGSHLRNPGTVASITKQSYSIEQEFTDVGKYFLMDGMRVGTFNMSVESGAIVTCSFDFTGRETTTSDTATLGLAPYTVLGSTNTEVMNATSNVGTVEKEGAALSQAVLELGFEADANLREQNAVGNKFPAGVGYGRFSLSGNMMVYFEDFEFYNIFINHQTTSLKFDFEDTDNMKYVFTIPALKISEDPISPTGIDTDVMEEIGFEAFRDSTLNTQMMIDRFSSVWPMTF